MNTTHFHGLKALLLAAVLFVLAPLAASAQIKVTGKVTGSSGDGEPGVLVYVRGNASTGAMTGADGTYSITVPSSKSVLVFSLIGYKDAGVIDRIRKDGTLLEEKYLPEGIGIKAYISKELYGKIKSIIE